MKEKQDDIARSDTHPLPGFGTNPFDKDSPGDLRDDRDGRDNYETDDEVYEEPERDTDYASGFREMRIDEDEAFDELLPEDLEADDEALFEEQSDFLRAEAGAQDSAGADTGRFDALRQEAPDDVPDDFNDDPASGLEDEPESWLDREHPAGVWRETEDYEEEAVPRAWAEEEGLPDDELDEGQHWPVGLIAVGVLALLLVVAGGYGVMQQRSATQEEIRELQAELATRANPEDLAASRVALQDLQARNAELTAALDALRLENQRLSDTVAGLEAQVEAQVEARAEAQAQAPAEPAATAAPAPPEPAPAKAEPEPAASAPSGGDWFVNFGSYSQQSDARAWADKLQVAGGDVVVAQGARDGKTFYRVRVIGLGDKAAAERVARQLEADYGLPKLWVGRQ